MGKTRLSELQTAVMNVLWERGEATVSDVREALAERDLATTTVATVLGRLLEAEAVDRYKDGREYVYRPQVSRRDVRSSMLGDLVDRLFGGSAEALLSHLVREDEVDPEELERLRRRLDEAESETDDPPSRG
jgi:predicted transcriptional regulator